MSLGFSMPVLLQKEKSPFQKITMYLQTIKNIRKFMFWLGMFLCNAKKQIVEMVEKTMFHTFDK